MIYQWYVQLIGALAKYTESITGVLEIFTSIFSHVCIPPYMPLPTFNNHCTIDITISPFFKIDDLLKLHTLIIHVLIHCKS